MTTDLNERSQIACLSPILVSLHCLASTSGRTLTGLSTDQTSIGQIDHKVSMQISRARRVADDSSEQRQLLWWTVLSLALSMEADARWTVLSLAINQCTPGQISRARRVAKGKEVCSARDS